MQIDLDSYVSVRPPGSKSMSIRALLLSALIVGQTELKNPGDCRDTEVMRQALIDLGVDIVVQEHSWLVTGPIKPVEGKLYKLYLENSGASVRFLTAVLAGLPGLLVELHGNEAMSQRPLHDLIETLNSLGAEIEYLGEAGYPPIRISGKQLAGAKATVDCSKSGQYASALLMAGLQMQAPLELTVLNPVSQPYIDMTVDNLQALGVVVERCGDIYQVQPTQLTGDRCLEIDVDASAAAFYFALAAILKCEIVVLGIDSSSSQADIAMLESLRAMGCEYQDYDGAVLLKGADLTAAELDLLESPDIAPVLSCVAACASGVTVMRGLGHLQYKECNRLVAIATELQGLGIELEQGEDFLKINGGSLKPAVVECYDDHRMAMSFYLLSLLETGIVIADRECVSKSYPAYFADMKKVLQALNVH